MGPFAKYQAKLAFSKAKKKANKAGEVLCATLGPEGKPIYFSLPQDASDDEVQDKAFEARVGRPMTQVERTLLQKAKERQAREESGGQYL